MKGNQRITDALNARLVDQATGVDQYSTLLV